MTVVIADTSPLNYLILIEEIELLPRLYGRVVVPHEVLSELKDSGAPSRVCDWATKPPGWLEVRTVYPGASSLSQLDPGERSAIILAQSEGDALLLIDDNAGRLVANRLGIPNTGTIGILRAASLERLVDMQSALPRLLMTNFRIAKALVEGLLAEDAERKCRPT